MHASTINIQTITLTLTILGPIGTITMLSLTGLVLWQYRQTRIGSYRWSLRSWRLKQLCAVACLFFLAMAASYAVILQPLAWVYLLVAFKVGTWWFRRSITQRA